MINKNQLQQRNSYSKCKRYLYPYYVALYSKDTNYNIKLSIVPSANIKNRKFKHKSVCTRGGESNFTLFKQCQCYLTIEMPINTTRKST